MTLAARALAAEEVDFLQSFATWPAPPQNRHRLLSKRRFLSSGVSFPSFPSLSAMALLVPELLAMVTGGLLDPELELGLPEFD